LIPFPVGVEFGAYQVRYVRESQKNPKLQINNAETPNQERESEMDVFIGPAEAKSIQEQRQ